MEDCGQCLKGRDCHGYVIGDLTLKLFDAVAKSAANGNADSISRALSREDMVLLDAQGEMARALCWSKGFVLVLARKIADLSKVAENDEELRTGMERLVVSIDGLFAKLPKGVRINLSELIVDVYNRVTEILATEGSTAVVPATILGSVITTAAQNRVT